MAKNIQPNKLNDRDKRRMENIRTRLRRQGVGEDEAAKRAFEEVLNEGASGAGGGSRGAGDKPKTTQPRTRARTGSR